MAAVLDNDTRGWIMAAVSGVACIFGACIICIDFLVRMLPGKSDFRIQNSDTFLSSSLSLSFGVMLFSALYSMLPQSKTSLVTGGLSPSQASWVLIACFLGGVIGIQILSRLFHHFMPSHVVGCEHTHDDEEEARGLLNESGLYHDSNHEQTDYTPAPSDNNVTDSDTSGAGTSKVYEETEPLTGPARLPRRLTSRVSSFLTGAKPVCDTHGPCYGFSDPCGKECFKIMKRVPTLNQTVSGYGSIDQSDLSMPDRRHSGHGAIAYEAPVCSTSSHVHHHDHSQSHSPNRNSERAGSDGDSSASTAASSHQHPKSKGHDNRQGHEKAKQHHHHVPSNAFLSIGLQTSFAIALHKLPEGFITYATNHANPELGFAVFVALFIHNITEGFALALPLFLAINSRWKAIVVSAVLGGASQPLGAGIAALWFHLAGPQGVSTSDSVYGCMFAVTSGIMTSVALQLFSESLGLTHSKTLCIIWAFVGMGILGCSNALTA